MAEKDFVDDASGMVVVRDIVGRDIGVEDIVVADIAVETIDVGDILEVGGPTDIVLVSAIIPLMLVAVGGPIVMSKIAFSSEQFPLSPHTHNVLPSGVPEQGLIKLWLDCVP